MAKFEGLNLKTTSVIVVWQNSIDAINYSLPRLFYKQIWFPYAGMESVSGVFNIWEVFRNSYS